MRKVWIWALAGGGVVVLLILALVVSGGFGPPVMGQSTEPWPAKTTGAYEAQLRTFEQDTKIPSASWYPHVTGRELQNSGTSLWVYTDLAIDDAGKAVAAQICGAYAKYVMVDPGIGTIVVRSGATRQLARCGPRA